MFSAMFRGIYCLPWVIIISFISGCAVENRRVTVTGTSHGLTDKLLAAIHKSGGVVTDLAELDWGAGLIGAPINKDATVIRPPVGGTFSLTCPVVDAPGSNESDPNNLPIWKHDGSLLITLPKDSQNFTPALCDKCVTCRCGRDYATRYQPSLSVASYVMQAVKFTSHTLHTVLMRNVTQWHAGKYECTHGGTVVASYLVAPRYTPRDVFSPPMENANVREGYSATFHCTTQFDMLPSITSYRHRFIWLLEDYVLYAPPGHPLAQRIAPAIVLGSGYTRSWDVCPFNSCVCRSTITIDQVLAHKVGRVQCLFKLDSFLNEWIVQTVNLTVRSEG